MKYLYKRIYHEAIAYLIPHQNLKTSQLDNHLVSIDYIEDLYELDLLSALDDVLETNVEKITLSKQW